MILRFELANASGNTEGGINLHGEVTKGEPSGVRLESTLENQLVTVDVLGNEGLAELDVGNADADPGEQVGNSGEVLEPVENVVGTRRHTHVCKERDRGGDCDSVVWDTGLGALKEDLGGLAVLSKSEEVSGTAVEEGIGGGRGGGQNDSVDD